MTSTSRRAVFAVLVVVSVVGAAVAVIAGISNDDTQKASSGATRVLQNAKADGREMVVYLHKGSRRTGGQVAVAPADAAASKPTLEPMTCDRVYFAASGQGLCVARGGGFAAGYSARIFGPDFKVRRAVSLEGIPSRARVSPDGRYGSVTMFVTGHSYAAAGSFSTETTLIDLRTGQSLGEVEDFTVNRGGRQVTAVDRNFWGVTFDPKDSDHFYATMATGGKTYLIEGSVSRRSAHAIHENVECPSLSPDGTRIAYKHRGPNSENPWRITVLDLATMRETPLADTKTVDDQVEWLDDSHVLYYRDGAIWTEPADGSGRPQQYLGGAESPAVVRY